jgi:hypothetical protein
MLHTPALNEHFKNLVSNLPAHLSDNFPEVHRSPKDTVIHDYPCGFGKSTRMIAGLKDDPRQQVLIVVPDLEQVRALIEAAADRHGVRLYQPLARTSPQDEKDTGSPFNYWHDTKREALQALIERGHNVITTHKLYSKIAHLAQIGMLREVEVHIDEVLSVADDATSITQFSRSPMKSTDWRSLYLDKGYVSICPETGRIDPTDAWREKLDDLSGNLPVTFFGDAEAGRLYTDVPGCSDQIIIEELPVILLKCSKKVNIYTYRFDGSYMAAYLQKHGIGFTKARYADVSPEEADRQFRARAADLVTIDAMPRLANVPLGFTAQRRMVTSKQQGDTANAEEVRAAFRSIGRTLSRQKVHSSNLILTCAQSGWTNKHGRSGKFAAGTKLFEGAHWVANQTRGTNQYRHCSHVAYFWRQNPNPHVARFLGCDDKRHADLYAVAEMIQFIWRSRIRDGQPITVFMPCPKMRRLWYRWLDGEI